MFTGFTTPYRVLKVSNTEPEQGYTVYPTYGNIFPDQTIYLGDGFESSTTANHQKKKRRSDDRHCDEPIDLEMKPTNDQPNDDEDNNNNKSPQIIQETRPSQMHTPVIEETPHSQMPSTSVETTSSTEKSPQTQ